MKLYDRTEQEIFDGALAHARKQGRRSVDKNGNCRYRSADGLKCFIGALISDEDYDPEFENTSTWFLPEIAVGKVDLKKTIRTILVVELQILHDKRDPKDWEAGFEDIAKHFGLIYTPPQQSGE